MGQGPAARLANSTGFALVAIAALAAPTLLLAYLPMTDLPQHTAVLSMLLHMDDPAFGFDAFYRVALERTLFLIPYGIGLGLATVLPLELAMRGVVFLALVAYPSARSPSCAPRTSPPRSRCSRCPWRTTRPSSGASSTSAWRSAWRSARSRS